MERLKVHIPGRGIVEMFEYNALRKILDATLRINTSPLVCSNNERWQEFVGAKLWISETGIKQELAWREDNTGIKLDWVRDHIVNGTSPSPDEHIAALERRIKKLESRVATLEERTTSALRKLLNWRSRKQ